MKKLLLTILLLTSFQALATCDLNKYQVSCIGKKVIHKELGKRKFKHSLEGTIKGIKIQKYKKSGKSYLQYKIKFDRLSYIYLEPASHLYLPKSGLKNWKSILISGDHTITNFDRSRIDLGDLLSYFGASKKDQSHLSAAEGLFKLPGIDKSTLENIETTFKSLKGSRKDGCLVFMTSHGDKKKGFYLSRSKYLTPEILAKYLDEACGKKPTVLLVSACYSGQFIHPKLQGDNRIILTASSSDRKSFGCSADTAHTYWDSCLLKLIPNSVTWNDAYENVKICIKNKEKKLGVKPSLPQAFFGSNMKKYEITKR